MCGCRRQGGREVWSSRTALSAALLLRTRSEASAASAMVPPKRRQLGPGEEAYRAQRDERDAAAAVEIGKDTRFATALNDPRFSRGLSRAQRTVAIDDRFAGMFTHADFQTKASVDKRGRKVSGGKQSKGEDLKRYYRLRDEGDWKTNQAEGGQEDAALEQDGAPVQGSTPAAPAAAAAGGATAQALPKGKKGGKAAAANGATQPAQKAADPDTGAKPVQKKGKQPAAGAAAAQPGGKAAAADVKVSKQGGKAAKPTPNHKAAAVGGKPAVGVRMLEDEDMLDGDDGSEMSEEDGSEMSEDASGRLRSGSDATSNSGSEEGAEEEEEEEEEEEGGEEGKARRRWERARGLAPGAGQSDSEGDESDESDGASSSSSYDSADEPLTEEEEDEEVVLQKAVSEWGVGAMAANPAERIPQGDETHRLAVVDQDWQHMRAVDILAGLQSFLSKGSRITRVTVYPSDYGLQRMAEEDTLGPQGILKPVAPKKAATGQLLKGKGAKHAASLHDDSDESDEVDDESDEGEDEDGSQGEGVTSEGDEGEEGNGVGEEDGSEGEDDDDEDEEDEGRELDVARLRMYEQSKLRYYYAVVECDSVATAVSLYTECDGMEFEHSACKLDLRFIPDDQSFQGRQMRDSATSVPADYQPPEVFTASLQHTDPTLTWDGEDVRRKKILQKKMTEDEIKEADFAAFLASSDDDDDDGPSGRGPAGGVNGMGKVESAAAVRERYRALLLGADKGKSKAGDDRGPREEETDEEDTGIQGPGNPRRVGGKSWGADGDDEDEGGSEEGGEAAGRGKGGKGKEGRGKNGRRGEYEMEVTYLPGLEGLGKKLLAQKRDNEAQKSESVWDAYLRRRRERRKEKRTKRKAGQDSSSEGEDGDDDVGIRKKQNDEEFFSKADGGSDDPFADPFFNDASQGVAEESDEDEEGGARPAQHHGKQKGDKSDVATGKKVKGKGALGKGKGEGAGNTAELELLLMDDDEIRARAARGAPASAGPGSATAEAADGGDGDMQSAGVPIKGKKAKRAAKKERAREVAATFRDDEDAAGFEADWSDPRFRDRVADHEFALDPTDPRFKAIKGTEVAKKLSALKKTQQALTTKTAAAAAAVQAAQPASQQQQEFNELRGMVAKLKRKGQQQQEQEQQQQQGAGAGSKKARK